MCSISEFSLLTLCNQNPMVIWAFVVNTPVADYMNISQGKC